MQTTVIRSKRHVTKTGEADSARMFLNDNIPSDRRIYDFADFRTMITRDDPVSLNEKGGPGGGSIFVDKKDKQFPTGLIVTLFVLAAYCAYALAHGVILSAPYLQWSGV